MFGWISDSLLYKQLVWHLPPKNREKREKGRKGRRAEGRASSRIWHGASHPQAPQAAAISPVPALSPWGRRDSKGSFLGPAFPLPCSLPSPKAQQVAHDAHSTPLSADEIKLLPSPPRPAPPLLPCFCLWLHSGSKSQRCLWCGVLPALILFCHVS